MHQYSTGRLFVFVLASLLVQFSRVVFFDQSLSDTVLESWESVTNSVTPMQCRLSVQAAIFPSDSELPNAPHIIDLKIGRNAAEKLVIDGNTVMGSNPWYTFELTRLNESSKDWFLVSAEERLKTLPKPQHDFLTGIDHRIQLQDIRLGLLRLASVPQLVHAGTFNLRELDTDAETGMVEIKFDCVDAEYDKGARKLSQHGVATLDPARNYLPVAYRAEFTLEAINEQAVSCSGTTTGKIVYAGDANSTIPSRYESVDDYTSLEIKYVRNTALKFSEFNPGEQEFMLSFFGLPEPEFLDKNRTFRFYAIVCLVGLLLLGTYFFLKNKK